MLVRPDLARGNQADVNKILATSWKPARSSAMGHPLKTVQARPTTRLILQFTTMDVLNRLAPSFPENLPPRPRACGISGPIEVLRQSDFLAKPPPDCDPSYRRGTSHVEDFTDFCVVQIMAAHRAGTSLSGSWAVAPKARR